MPAVAQRSCNLQNKEKSALCCVLAMSGHQGWADLPDVLLQSIVALLGSFSDLLAFAATCGSWCDALSSYLFKSTFSTLFPPLLLQPDVPVRSPCIPPKFGNKYPRRVLDLPSQHSRLCSRIPLVNLSGVSDDPQSPLGSFCFVGASYGYLIFSSNRSCLIVDAFTGVSVSPPQQPGDEYTEVYYGALTAPLMVTNSHLLVTNGSHSFFWHGASHSWLRPCPCDGMVKQIVTFRGQIFGMDSGGMLFVVHLAPQISIGKMIVSWEEIMSTIRHLTNVTLVACGDMLLMVGCRGSFPGRGDTFEAFRLDQSTGHPKWVKVEVLMNWVIFISTDKTSQPLSFTDPERWGEKSNHVYCYSHDSEHWAAFELGKPASNPSNLVFMSQGSVVQPMWVVPACSLCAGDGCVLFFMHGYYLLAEAYSCIRICENV